MKVCPNCGSENTDPRADLVYKRECQDCLWMGVEEDFDPDPQPLWSWHIVEVEAAWQVVQIKHFPASIEVEHLTLRMTQEGAQDVIDALRASAATLDRILAYP